MNFMEYVFIIILSLCLQICWTERHCKIHDTSLSSENNRESCNVTVHFEIAHGCFNSSNKIKNIKLKENLHGLLCVISYIGGECDQQTGCTCGETPQTFTVTRRFSQSERVVWDIVVELHNGTLLTESVILNSKCQPSPPEPSSTEELTSHSVEIGTTQKEYRSTEIFTTESLDIDTTGRGTDTTPKNHATYGTPAKVFSTEAPQTDDGYFTSFLFLMGVSVFLALAVIALSVTLVVVCRRTAGHTVRPPRNARRKPTYSVAFRQVPAEDAVLGRVSVDTHHSYIDILDDIGHSTSGDTAAPSDEAEDIESDDYNPAYVSPDPTSRGSNHHYSIVG